MANPSLPEHAPGKYVPYEENRAYYSPDELPPDLQIEYTGRFNDVLQEAIYELGHLNGVAQESDANPLVYTTMVRREAVQSILLEGGDLGLEDMFRPSEIDGGDLTRKDVQEAVNYEEAIQKGAERVRTDGTITLRLLKDLHRMLLDGVRDEAEHPGEFRDRPVVIPPPSTTEDPFVPPSPTRVPELMANLAQYLATGGGYHDLVELALVHYQFETIHPFGDGNGRLGRVLVTLQLIQQGNLAKPFLYPSAYFNEHKTEYVRRMRQVSEEGAWQPWLEFFIDGIRQQAADAVARTERLRDLREAYESDYGSRKTTTDRLAMALFEKPYVTTANVEEKLDVTHQTARNAIRELEASGILEETTGQDRYQKYKAVDIFDILNEPIE